MDGIDKLGGASDLARLLGSSGAATPVAAATPAADTTTTAQPQAAATANLISILADSAPPVDSKKVEAIKALIASGAYPIDSRAIAAKMVSLDLPGTKSEG